MHLIGSIRAYARQMRFAGTVLAQHELHRRTADRRQLALDL